MPTWLLIVVIAIGLTAVGVVGIKTLFLRHESADYATVIGVVLPIALLVALGVVLLPRLFGSIFLQPAISANEYKTVGSKQLDTLEEVEDRFGEESEDLAHDLGTGGRGETCRWYWTSRWKWNQDDAYELCFKKKTGKFTSKNEVNVEHVPVPGG